MKMLKSTVKTQLPRGLGPILRHFILRVMIDLMTLEGTPVVHIVDKDTLLSGAAFLHEKVDTKSVWDAFLRIWAAAYAGFSAQVHADQGKNLQDRDWQQMMRDAGVKPLDSGIESHNSLGAGERYHMMLRQAFRVIRMDHPRIPVEVPLALALWAMSQTAGPARISPQSLVRGAYPRMPVKPIELPGHRERCRSIVEARAAIVKMVAQARLKRYLDTGYQILQAKKSVLESALRIGSAPTWWRGVMGSS